MKPSDIPANFESWSSIVEFAATFDPRKESVSVKGIDILTPDSTVAERRAALFFEYRRYNHFGYPPSDETERKCVSVIESIRTEIQK